VPRNTTKETTGNSESEQTLRKAAKNSGYEWADPLLGEWLSWPGPARPPPNKQHHSKLHGNNRWYKLPGQPISLPYCSGSVAGREVPMSLQTYPRPGEIRNRDEWRFADD
jgi:hypothetical protein